MALQDIVQVNISLETTAVSQAGFGTPIFIGAHRWFPERVRSYSSLVEVAEDIPTDAQEYKAAQKFFSQSPRPSVIKIGRREAAITITPDTPTEGDVYTMVVTDGLGNSVNVSYTAASLPDAEDVVDGLIADIEDGGDVGAAVVATKTGTGASAVLTLTAASGYNFTIGSLSENLTATSSTTETAAVVMAAITAVDDDFYFVTAHDHTSAFVLAMADDIEARSKVFFTSSQEAGSLTTLATPATDTLGKLFEGEYFRSHGMFAADADTTFPECAIAGRIGPYTPGTFVVSNKVVAGVAAATDPATDLKLSATQKNNLVARNASFVTTVGGVNIYREGKVAGGEWIEKKVA